MEFNVMYVEHNRRDQRRLQESVDLHNASGGSPQINLTIASDPEDAEEKLTKSVDLIIADHMFLDNEGVERRPGLAEIIRMVERATQRDESERQLPIIAYTRRGGDALREALKFEWELYDILDKNSASPSYVVWRLVRLWRDLARMRPDALLQRRIREMSGGAPWHELVVEMADRYDAGWTEADQISRAGHAIAKIGDQIGAAEVSTRLWDVMASWELLSRAILPKGRGHARHVINVFWLGYYLMYSPALKPLFESAFSSLLYERSGMGAVNKEGALDFWSKCWFFAALFHDVGACVEKRVKAASYCVSLLEGVLLEEGGEKPRVGLEWSLGGLNLTRMCSDVLDDCFETQERRDAHRVLISDDEDIDHGLVSAASIMAALRATGQRAVGREAARAMSVHNVVEKLPRDLVAKFDWRRDPLICLLVLCDQIQAWDRDVGTHRLDDPDEPRRAELSALEVVDGERPQVRLEVVYIMPRHVERTRVLFKRMEDRLSTILREYPERSLERLSNDWPFDLMVNFRLGEKVLQPSVKIPR